MVLAFVAAMGIPSAIMGLIIWRLERRIDKREKEQAAQEQGQKDLFVLVVQGTNAAIALGEATARAVQRIPDAHCNGDKPGHRLRGTLPRRRDAALHRLHRRGERGGKQYAPAGQNWTG